MYYIYIISNKYDTVIYIGITNNLIRRIYEHKLKLCEGFTSKYQINKLVYYEVFQGAEEAINREKQLKRWSREKKNNLIKKVNPKWEDLYLKII